MSGGYQHVAVEIAAAYGIADEIDALAERVEAAERERDDARDDAGLRAQESFQLERRATAAESRVERLEEALRGVRDEALHDLRSDSSRWSITVAAMEAVTRALEEQSNA